MKKDEDDKLCFHELLFILSDNHSKSRAEPSMHTWIEEGREAEQ